MQYSPDDVAWAIEEYTTRLRSTNAIARELGCGDVTIANWIRRAGLSVRSMPEQKLIDNDAQRHPFHPARWFHCPSFKIRWTTAGGLVGRWFKGDVIYELSQHYGTAQYLTVASGGSAPQVVHRLVADAWIRPLQDSDVVHHIDGDIHNNHYLNLQIMADRSEHQAHHVRARGWKRRQ